MSKAFTANLRFTTRQKRFLKLARWVLFIASLWGWGLALAALPEGVWRIDSAIASLQPEAQPTVEATVNLPHRWDKSYPRDDGRVMYRFPLPVMPAGERMALFLPRVGNQAIVRFDGLVISRLGEIGNPRSDSTKAPVWLELPVDKAALARHTVEVEVTAQAGRWGGLSEVYLGSVVALQPMYESNTQWRQTSAMFIVVSLSLMGLISAGLWLKQRDDHFGLFAFAALFGVVRMADRLLPVPPLPWPLWGGFAAAAFALHALCVARFSIHVVRVDHPGLKLFFNVFSVAAVGAAFAAFMGRWPGLWTAILALLVIPGATAMGCVLWQAYRTRSREAMLMSIAGAVVLLAGVRDFLVVRVGDSGSATFSILPLATFVLVIFMAWTIVERYSQQVRQYRELTQSLERRVSEREAELATTHRQLQEQSKQQATLQERQRIMRDIHDGLGAHLVGLLNLIRKGNARTESMEEHAKAALDELRIAVDSLQPVHGDLATVLATLRYRLQPRLQAAGLEVIWEVDELPIMSRLTPEMVVQIQRLLLEAFTNVMRHAKASRLEVTARSMSGKNCLLLTVADNGIGWPQGECTPFGHGLTNMRARAMMVGATLTLDARPGGGARLQIEMPVG